ncbi:MAG: stage II sporulation protein M [Defluviitaleaceae bacterium]|nr:stage II sporulation protein M [Defluviitaleaceae bacterium]
MKETVFIARNEENWKALEVFNDRLRSTGRRGVKSLAAEEVREFARLFRLAGHHLAYAKTHFPAGSTVPYLNRVVGVAHNFFYVREQGSLFQIKQYFGETLPRTIRETYKYWGLATAVFVIGLLLGAIYVGADTTRLAGIMPAMFGEGFTPGETPEFAFDGDNDAVWDGALMSAFFITNNTTVAFNAFALGILGGVFTLFVMFYNGLIVGALFGFLHVEGADMVTAYALILPHGVTELFAIFLAGGAGLMLGKGVLLPGNHTRRHSLVLQARKAVLLIPGIAILMFIAAFIEGFFTPLPISPAAKFAFAALTGIGTFFYCMKGAWRRR